MEKRRVTLVGCGGISSAWMGPIEEMDDVEIVGVCDLDDERIDAFVDRWRVAPAARGADLERVIRESESDTVFDCTVPEAHPVVTKTALALGCDVLGEKPMAPSIEEARSMVAAATAAGRTYAVLQNRRFFPEIRRFRRAIVTASDGALHSIDADFWLAAHFGGFRAAMRHVLLVDMAIHTFDAARFLSGADATRVLASDWNPTGSWFSHGAAALALFEMTGGARFTYRGNWVAAGLQTSYESRWRAGFERASIVWDGAQSITGERELDGTEIHRPSEPFDLPAAETMSHTRHGGVIREFLDALGEGRKPETDCTDNFRSIAMVHAAVESAEVGGWVEVPGA